MYKPGSEFQTTIVITIAIKNCSGKIDLRFLFRNRSAISGSKSDPVFRFKIDPRLKNSFRNKNLDGTQNRIPIFRSKLIHDFIFSTAIRFSDQNRDRNCDQKLFRKNRSAIFIEWVFRYPLAGTSWQFPHSKSDPNFYAPPSTFARNPFPSGLVNNGSSDSATTALRSAITVSLVIGLNPCFSVIFL
jgi:hypothetical protein